MTKFWSSWGFGCALLPYNGQQHRFGYVPQEVLTISQLGMKLGSINDFIVDRIMSTLEGSVSVGEAPGGGALFTLVFPMTAAVSEPIQMNPHAAGT